MRRPSVCPVRQRAGTSCSRRCSRRNTSTPRSGPRQRPRRSSSATASGPKNRMGCTSRNRSGASWWIGSAGSASTRAAARLHDHRHADAGGRRSDIAEQIKSIEHAAPHGRLAARPEEAREERGTRAASARGRRARALSWRSSQTPGTCGQWSAAATSMPDTSTGRFKRIASPDPLSSRSSTRPRSRRAIPRPP